MFENEAQKFRKNEFRDLLNDKEAYKAMVRDMIVQDSDEIFPNTSYSHAVIVLNEFIRNATNGGRVSIFCRRLSKAVYDNVELIETVADAIRRQVKIRILMQETTPEASDFISLFENPDNHIKTVIADEDKNKPNFAEIDKKMYRYEYDRITRAASVCVRGNSIANTLANWFDWSFEQNATPIKRNVNSACLCNERN